MTQLQKFDSFTPNSFFQLLAEHRRLCLNAKSSTPISGDRVSGGKLLLLVEDEPLIQLLVEDVLKAEGYSVITADNGAEGATAVEYLAAQTSAIITDIRLGPGPNGWEIARQARVRMPELPIVFITGDSAHEWPSHGVTRSIVVQKPFRPDQVLKAVTDLLQAA